MEKLTDCYIMQNGVKIPCVGFGTWQTPSGQTAVNAVKCAVKCGYRHIDTAAVYGNEKSVGKAIAECGVPREQLFVTSKLWNTERGYEKTLRAFRKTLSDLRLDYLDLYLIHWPAVAKQDPNWQKTNAETWRAFEELYGQGKIRAIGVSNFLPHHLEALMEKAKVSPMVNQIELHVGQTQPENVSFCKKNHMLVEAWSPLGTGKMLTNPALISMAAKYGVSVARLCIRWCLQNGLLPLPKSITPTRIEENTHVFDFAISEEDMAVLNGMEYCGDSGLNPDEVDF